MSLTNLFRKPPALTATQEVVQYTLAIATESKELQRLQQAYIISKGDPEAKQAYDQAVATLRVMQDILARLVARADKETREQA